jgi:hypothetical protein
MLTEDSISHYNLLSWRDRTLTKQEYNDVIENRPVLRSKPGYMPYFAYLALHPIYEKDTGYIISPHTLIAKYQGKRPKHSNADAFLQAFKHDVLPSLCYTNYSKDAKRCRVITYTGIAHLVQDIAQNPSRDRVYLDGAKQNYRNQLEAHKRQLDAAKKDMEQAPYELQKTIGSYLHNLPFSLFRDLVNENFDRAWEVALMIENEKGQQEALQHLQAIWDLPMPYYHTKGRQPRLYTQGYTLVTVNSPVRRALLGGGLVEFDLTASNIAIVATVWGIKSIQAIFKNEQPFWTVLLTDMGIPKNQQAIAKPIVKEQTHSLCYGLPSFVAESRITKAFHEQGITQEKTFQSCRFISDLLAAREQAVVSIKAKKGCDSAFGWEPYDGEEPINTFLSRIIGTYELAIIGACFNLAIEQEKDLRIVCYEYDGFTAQIKRKGRQERIIQDIQHAAKVAALDYGIYTSLQVHK